MKTHLRLVWVVSFVISISLLACSTSPTAPTSLAPPPVANVAGDYALTVLIDERCVEFPESLRVWAYRAILEDQGYISIRVVGGAFTEPTAVGQLYVHGNSRFRFVLNFDYEGLDRYPESPELLLYGGGTAVGTGSSISGAVLGTASFTGRAGIRCDGSHRFTFARRAGQAG